MISLRPQWSEVAQLPNRDLAGDLQEWFTDEGIEARIRPYRRERPRFGTASGYRGLANRTPVIIHYSVEVRRSDRERVDALLRESGWRTEEFQAGGWLSQQAISVGVAIAATAILLAGLRILVG